LFHQQEETLMSADGSSMIAVDSLVANEFAVEIDGQIMLGVFRISGFTPFKLAVAADGNTPVTTPFVLAKMVQRNGNNAFNQWLRETVANAGASPCPRRTLAIVAIDDGVETRRWTINGAWISAVGYSDFDTGSSEMVEETVTIHYDSIEETWSATPDA
jgi:phage tail-like protein